MSALEQWWHVLSFISSELTWQHCFGTLCRWFISVAGKLAKMELQYIKRDCAKKKTNLHPYQFANKHNRSAKDTTLTLLHNAYIHILKNHIHLSRFSSLTFLLPSVPYNHTSWQANFWNWTLTQHWFSGLLTFVSIVLRQFVTKLYSRLPALFPPALHKALSYLLFFLHSTQMTAQAPTQLQS